VTLLSHCYSATPGRVPLARPEPPGARLRGRTSQLPILPPFVASGAPWRLLAQDAIGTLDFDHLFQRMWRFGRTRTAAHLPARGTRHRHGWLDRRVTAWGQRRDEAALTLFLNHQLQGMRGRVALDHLHVHGAGPRAGGRGREGGGGPHEPAPCGSCGRGGRPARLGCWRCPAGGCRRGSPGRGRGIVHRVRIDPVRD
jgi:hypothetical protein